MSATNVPAPAVSGEAQRARARLTIQHRRAFAMRGVYLLVALVGAVAMIFPVYWLIVTALKPASEVFTNPPILFPSQLQWHNFPDTIHSSALPDGDRKSTRLNSSHPSISYAVFCLKKKNINNIMFLFFIYKTIAY